MKMHIMLSKIILNFVHLVLFLYTQLCETFLVCWSRLTNLLYGSSHHVNFKTDIKTLQKVPIHLGIVLTEEGFSLSDVASVIIWSIGVGISYISVYDRNGYLKQRHFELKEKTEEKCTNYEKLKRFQIYSPAEINSNNKVYEYDRGKEAAVVLLSSVDCRKDIVKTAKNVSILVKSKHMKYNDINTESVDKLIKEQWGFPDPDLVIKFGQVESLMGYLPWQTRLTEILNIATVNNITYRNFLSTLHRYASSKQRFGK